MQALGAWNSQFRTAGHSLSGIQSRSSLDLFPVFATHYSLFIINYSLINSYLPAANTLLRPAC
ncbi:MAG: hypothetical protein J6A01_08575, partial [Proteobacteria bacterium]|nr:hypothetical protein [Pseudomonadota bacterium]